MLLALLSLFTTFFLVRERNGVDLDKCHGQEDMGGIKNGERLTRICFMKEIYFQYKKRIEVNKHLKHMIKE